MPHVLIEYTVDSVNNQQLSEIMRVVYQAVADSQLFNEDNIKLRAIAIQHYRLGNAGKGFIHVQSRIHQGRSDQQKQLLSESILQALRSLSLALQVSTCEVVDMDRNSYCKHLNPL